MSESKTNDLLETPIHVINIGLEGFAAELALQGIDVIQVDWVPPANGSAVSSVSAPKKCGRTSPVTR